MKEEVELVNGKFVVKGKQKEEVKPSKQKVILKQYSKETLVLRERIIAGNTKLNEAWGQICQIPHDSQQWNDEEERWHLANGKLSELCNQLEEMGYTDCLYIDENGKKTKKCLEPGPELGCRVCSSIYPYWEKEFLDL